MNNFLPENYAIPSGSNYYKLLDGENTFRIVGSAIVGYEYWRTDNKPVRSREPFQGLPADIRYNEDGTPSKIKAFWAFAVFNYDENKVQVMEITQKTIMEAIKALVENKKWGDPKKYDITISRSGSGFDTTYQVMPNPHGELTKDQKEIVANTRIKLENLYEMGDPFADDLAKEDLSNVVPFSQHEI